MIHHVIKDIRVLKKYSQREAALKIGITSSYLCELEKGSKTMFSLDLLNAIASAYGIPTWSIVLAADMMQEGKLRGDWIERLSLSEEVKTLLSYCGIQHVSRLSASNEQNGEPSRDIDPEGSLIIGIVGRIDEGCFAKLDGSA